MKKETVIRLLALFLTIGMTGCKQSDTQDGLLTIDVTASYPEKELILQEFMDVEYVPLETSDDFITQGVVMAIGDKFIIVKNSINDGNIYMFDRKTGKGIRKINRLGRGPEEYAHVSNVILDEEKNELFVNSVMSKKIFVYDLYGNFKRSFNHTKDTQYSDLFNYDKDHLIRYDMTVYYREGEKADGKAYHAIISKQDGSITQDIAIPFDVVKSPCIRKGDMTLTSSVNPILPYQNRWLLFETSSDTAYSYLPKENKLSPFLCKKPTSDPDVFLTMGTITDDYYFIRTIKREADFSKLKGFPSTDLMYDRQEKALFNAAVINGDYKNKQKVDMISYPVDSKIAVSRSLSVVQLVEAYENNELKGELKEVAATLDEESNPVIMLIKYTSN